MSLTVKDLTKRYGDRTVVDRLSFGMPGPGVYALLGTNGAGKTTSIRMMLNMLSRDGGEVLWNGEPLDISRCNVGYLAEERGLYPKYALMDQLLYFAALRDVPRAEAKRRIRYWAQRLEVEEFCTDLTILDRSKTVLQGHLNDIKKGYGRVHLQLKTEEDAGPYIAESGAQIVTRKEFEYQLKVTGQEQANDLLARLTRAGVTVVLFNLREPSLHEIFVETVGGESDA